MKHHAIYDQLIEKAKCSKDGAEVIEWLQEMSDNDLIRLLVITSIVTDLLTPINNMVYIILCDRNVDMETAFDFEALTS